MNAQIVDSMLTHLNRLDLKPGVDNIVHAYGIAAPLLQLKKALATPQLDEDKTKEEHHD